MKQRLYLGLLHHVPSAELGLRYALKHSGLQDKPLACLDRTGPSTHIKGVDLTRVSPVEEWLGTLLSKGVPGALRPKAVARCSEPGGYWEVWVRRAEDGALLA